MQDKKSLLLLDTKVNTAEENMRIDGELLDRLDPDGSPILHLYEWAGPCLTYGFFIRPEKHIRLEKAKCHRIELARRPTGGGIVFHIWDLAFSFLMPANHPAYSAKTLANYEFVNSAVMEAVSSFLSLEKRPSLTQESFPSKTKGCQNFCMAKPTEYDVVLDKKKVAGASQRRRRQGYLHQGTISLAMPQLGVLKDLLLSKTVLEAMVLHTFAPLGKLFEPSPLKEAREELKKRLEEKLMEKLAPFS